MLKWSWTAATPTHLTNKEQNLGPKEVHLTSLFELLCTGQHTTPHTKDFNLKFNSGGDAAQLQCACNIIIPGLEFNKHMRAILSSVSWRAFRATFKHCLWVNKGSLWSKIICKTFGCISWFTLDWNCKNSQINSSFVKMNQFLKNQSVYVLK